VCTWLRESFVNDDLFTLAASIAYAAILSLFPLLIGLVVMMSRFVETGHAEQPIMGTLEPYLPPSALALVRRTLEGAVPSRGAAGVVAVVGLFWSATAVVSALRHGLNRVLRARRARPFWHRKLLEMAMVVLGGAFLSISLLASVAAAVARALRAVPAASNPILTGHVSLAVEVIGSWLLSGLAFLIIYRFLPNVRLSSRSLFAGALTAVVLFEVVRSAFFWYLGTLARYPSVYGPLVGVVVFMVWVYLVALVLLVGAETMAQVERARTGKG